MKRWSAAVVMFALLVVAAPTQAQEVVDVLAPCTSTSGAEVVTLEGLESTIATPAGAAYSAAETKQFILSLAGSPLTENRKTVEVVMSWDVPVEDYDLDMPLGGEEAGHSENVQPLDGAEEAVSGEVKHCQRFDIEASAWAAPAGLSTLSLDLTVVP